MFVAAICRALPTLALLATCSPPGHPIVTEVLYDAPGDDTGWEFVELLNPLALDVALAGLQIQAGDGAGPGRWTTRWTAGPGDTIRAGTRFVIGGAKLSPPPDAEVTLDLQNGPDGMRLLWPDGATEVLGWGALAYPEYYCGAPAIDVAPGQSLARVPDDADHGSNAADFQAAEPSPGRANRPATDLALERGSLALEPGNPQPLEALRVTLRAIDRGAAADSGATLLLSGDALADSVRALLPALAPGETLAVALAAQAGAAGRRWLVARAQAAGDEAPGNDVDSLLVRVGPGPLELTEIQFHPAAGEGEWLEVRNRSPLAVPLEGDTIEDRSNNRGHVVDPVLLAPESLAVLAQDRDALLAVFPSLDPTRVAATDGWPSLNNSDASDGIADVVTLSESDGLLSDRVAYSAAGVPAGVTLEKREGLWQPSASARGTPLSPPPAIPDDGARFTVSPRRLALTAPEAEFRWRLPWPQGRVTLELYDLAGHHVARLLADEPSATDGVRQVSLAGAGTGVFAAVLIARSGRASWTGTQLVRIGGNAR
ncbi:MAG TPA: lamin tail domain-containing protein [Candidatus Acidoferrales bacterium]|nr:lamin tail domain-containing protein [Candidatus Acidoferrales bacterium]